MDEKKVHQPLLDRHELPGTPLKKVGGGLLFGVGFIFGIFMVEGLGFRV